MAIRKSDGIWLSLLPRWKSLGSLQETLRVFPSESVTPSTRYSLVFIEIFDSSDISAEIANLPIGVREVEYGLTRLGFRANGDGGERNLPDGRRLLGKTDNDRIVVPLVPDVHGQLEAGEDREQKDTDPEETLQPGPLLLAQIPDAVNRTVIAVLMDDCLGCLEAAAVFDLSLGIHLIFAVIGNGLAAGRGRFGHQGGALPLARRGQHSDMRCPGHLQASDGRLWLRAIRRHDRVRVR